MKRSQSLKSLAFLVASLALMVAQLSAQSFSLDVVGSSGETVSGYRWLLEEDRTYQVQPGVQDPGTLANGFHTSYMPLAGKGSASGPTTVLVDPTKPYYVSVLPDSGFGMGGARVLPGQTQVTVVVQTQPVPTAQLSIFCFRDDSPINGEPDLPAEGGLAGFSVKLEDGIAGGQLLYDAYGNPLGTTYSADGSVDVMGDGNIYTDANGEAVVQNLYPGKYGVQLVPPVGQDWIQTSTIEGKKIVDAWIKADEPPFFMEFGPPGYHVFIGFMQPMKDNDFFTGSSTVTGRVVNMHLSRPPEFTFAKGEPLEHTTPWIGINDTSVGLGRGVYVAKANADGTFTVDGLPPGRHQLAIWDQYLDFVFGLANFDIPAGGGNVDLGDVGAFQWFGRLENHVFYDANENGLRDSGETGMLEQAVNIRYRDGTIYQSFPTDLDGFVPFDQVFPFFHWLVAEVDFARYKATGATITVDAGGEVDPSDPNSHGGVLNPQLQPDNGMAPYRTETGPVLTQGIQTFLGQTNVIEWGKKNYAPGENGGISGVVLYGVTRAEDDPANAAAEPWEPGIPRVVVNLYKDTDANGVIDDLDGSGGPTLADADNYPFGNFPGLEDIDRNGNFLFDAGDAIQIATTDSWDDSQPEDCPGDANDPFFFGGRGYDGMRNWNQVRPGVFDGGYAFGSYVPGGISSGAPESDGLPAGTYIVEAVTPRALDGSETYVVMAEEHKNVDFGDEFTPPLALQALVPEAVGDLHLVPDELVLFPGVPAPFAGQLRPLADRKMVVLADMQNAAVDFFLCTDVPIGAHVVGFVLNDLANEFDPNSPQFGEKHAPPWLPVTFRDWAGNVVSRVYTDEWGKYNAVLPSTFTANAPSPSGFSPNMLTVTVNDSGPIPDPSNPGQSIIDPHYNPQFSQFTYTLQFMPGATTYLDTPVLPVAAFAGPDQFLVDNEPADGIPALYRVRSALGGPYVAATGENLVIESVGTLEVLNPAYDGAGGTQPKTITRDYGFGDVPGTVSVAGKALTNVVWTNDTIIGDVAPGTTTGQLKVKRGDNGLQTEVGITVTVGPIAGNVTQVFPSASPGAKPIQDAIDAATPGDLLLVQPGFYEESVILWKPVFLQGAGEHSTIINAVQAPSDKLVDWREHVRMLVEDLQVVDLLPAQNPNFGGLEPGALATEEGAGVFVLAKDLPVEDGGFGLVNGKGNARIDGFSIVGSSLGGGVVVNGYARGLAISNNRIAGNAGFLGGGIRSGHPLLTLEQPDGSIITQPCFNEDMLILRNRIAQNGGLGGSGGGISLYTGSDRYQVSKNQIVGNFTIGGGAGIAHDGLSDGGVIDSNVIRYNQSFDQATTVSGGGILVAGVPPLGGAGGMSQGSGSVFIGTNLIQGNQAGAGDGGGIRLERINGQELVDSVAAMMGDRTLPASGGKTSRKQSAKGASVGPGGAVPGPKAPPVGPAGSVGTPTGYVAAIASNWYAVDVVNNVITNNMAGLAGGGISIQDAVGVRIVHNTVAHNDSTATAGEAFAPGSISVSTPQPAGIVSHAHTPTFASALPADAAFDPYRTFSNPMLANNIVWKNRSFHFEVDPGGLTFGLVPDVTVSPPVYRDLGVIGTVGAEKLRPFYSVLTDTTGHHVSNVSGDPRFRAEYQNGDRGQTVLLPETKTSLQAAVAFDEGGNFIDIRFGPLTPVNPFTGSVFSDAHILPGSSARGAANPGLVGLVTGTKRDFDGDLRTGSIDIGADQSGGQ